MCIAAQKNVHDSGSSRFLMIIQDGKIGCKRSAPTTRIPDSTRIQKFLDRLRRIIYPFLSMCWNIF